MNDFNFKAPPMSDAELQDAGQRLHQMIEHNAGLAGAMMAAIGGLRLYREARHVVEEVLEATEPDQQVREQLLATFLSAAGHKALTPYTLEMLARDCREGDIQQALARLIKRDAASHRRALTKQRSARQIAPLPLAGMEVRRGTAILGCGPLHLCEMWLWGLRMLLLQATQMGEIPWRVLEFGVDRQLADPADWRGRYWCGHMVALTSRGQSRRDMESLLGRVFAKMPNGGCDLLLIHDISSLYGRGKSADEQAKLLRGFRGLLDYCQQRNVQVIGAVPPRPVFTLDQSDELPDGVDACQLRNLVDDPTATRIEIASHSRLPVVVITQTTDPQAKSES